MLFNLIQCSDNGRLRFRIGFSNDSMHANDGIFVPDKSLVGEGFWDESENRLCFMACRILNAEGSSFADASVGDCTIGLSLGFPAVWSISIRSTTVGRIWSRKNKNDAGYFNTVSFRSSQNRPDSFPGLKYQYTKLDSVKKFCGGNNVTKPDGKWRYPDGTYFGDMQFSISPRGVNGNDAPGRATPLFIGETYHENDGSFMTNSGMNHTLWNVAYELSYPFRNASSVAAKPTVIAAEGRYNAETGMLCMVGCQNPDSPVARKRANGVDSNSMDCEILINLQVPPLDVNAGENFNGTIRSLREKSDPLFFDPLEVSSSSMYQLMVAEMVWRMDIEIIIVVISSALSCIFIRIQFYHHKKHFPSISITMLVVLTLGHMIPLILNFGALFYKNHNPESFLYRSSRWLEANEVIVRVMTMVAFLLHFRLLQVAWSSRSVEAGKKGLWVAEKRALMLCLRLYLAGGLIAWFVHTRSYEIKEHGSDYFVERHSSLWEALASYGGLILDGFLLPQIIFNVFWNSKDKALAPFFYVGTTILRAVPHLYDAYRAHHHVPHLIWSYIYAGHDGDLYSTGWNIIIPCQGVLFAFLIYLQQRFGGDRILPKRFRKHGEYETVPSP